MYLLVAVDGTLSAADYNTGTNTSHTRKFYDRFHGASRHFFEGPGEGPGGLGGVIGTDVDNITERAWDALVRDLRRLGDSTEIRIVLVGHSRGGHIVVDLAKRLQRTHVGDFTPAFRDPMAANTNPRYQVHFMGLYDAVDMTWNGDNTDTIPANIRYYAHAMRSPDVGSRSSWGNAGWDVMSTEEHRTRFFRATHGSIGGAPPSACSSDLALISDQCNIDLTEAQNRAGGENAHRFILENAGRAGVVL